MPSILWLVNIARVLIGVALKLCQPRVASVALEVFDTLWRSLASVFYLLAETVDMLLASVMG